MLKIDFWKKISNISSIISAIVLVLKLFFRPYIKSFTFFFIIGIVSVLFYFISEIMKLILNKKK